MKNTATLTTRQGVIAIAPALLYLTAVQLWHGQLTGSDEAFAIFLYIVWPALFALFLGVKGKRLIVGILGGSLMGLSAVLAIMTNNRMNRIVDLLQSLTAWSEWLSRLAMFIPCGALIGVIGTLVQGLYHKKVSES